MIFKNEKIMSTIEILLSAILIAIMSLVAASVMTVLNKNLWEARSRLEKDKKSKEYIEKIREELKLVDSWKGHFIFFANIILFGTFSSIALYNIVKFFNS